MYVENLKEFSQHELTPTLALRGCLTTVKVFENSVNPLIEVLIAEEARNSTS